MLVGEDFLDLSLKQVYLLLKLGFLVADAADVLESTGTYSFSRGLTALRLGEMFTVGSSDTDRS